MIPFSLNKSAAKNQNYALIFSKKYRRSIRKNKQNKIWQWTFKKLCL